MEDKVHPHLAQSLTTERIREWQKEAAQARLARQARHGRRSWRGWGAWRTRTPAPASLTSPSGRPVPPAQPVTGRPGAAGDRPVAAGDHKPVAAEDRQPAGTRAA
jgi:hypothetical protein